MAVVRFLTSWPGRIARIVVGIVIMSVGVLVVRGTPGTIMAVIALVPIGAGLFDYCLLGTLMGYSLSGAKTREQLAAKAH